jgi:hypothetical protein
MHQSNPKQHPPHRCGFARTGAVVGAVVGLRCTECLCPLGPHDVEIEEDGRLTHLTCPGCGNTIVAIRQPDPDLRTA